MWKYHGSMVLCKEMIHNAVIKLHPMRSVLDKRQTDLENLITLTADEKQAPRNITSLSYSLGVGKSTARICTNWKLVV
jgi:hypothetical protein